MEAWEIAVFGLVIALTTTITTILYNFLRDYSIFQRLASLEEAYKSLNMRIANNRSTLSREEMSDRMSEAMAEAAAMVSEKKPLEEIIRTLLPKYPDIALKLGGKLLKGQLGGGLSGLKLS